MTRAHKPQPSHDSAPAEMNDSLPIPAGQVTETVEATEAPAAPVSQLLREAQLEAELEEQKVKAAAAAIQFAELKAVVEELQERLGRPKDLEAATIHIVGKACNQEAQAKLWAQINRKPAEEAPEFAKSFTVRPVGDSAKKGLPIAVCTNVSDESDAKAQYCLKLGVSGAALSCEVFPSDSVDA